jgi:glutaconate CoA-transferase, subunit B
VLTSLHPGATEAQARVATRWDLTVAADLRETDPPTGDELAVLRHLEATRGQAA